MNKNFIRITENDLHMLIKESVNKILNEYTFGRYMFDGVSPDDKKRYQMEDDWFRDREKPYDYYTANDLMYNHNVHDNAFTSSGSKRSDRRLDSFESGKRGDMSRRFNGTLNSLKK